MSTVATQQLELMTLTLQDPKSYFKKVKISTEWRVTPTTKNMDTDSQLSASSYMLSDIGESSKFDLDLELQMGAIEEENYDEDDGEENVENYQYRMDILSGNVNPSN